MFEFDTWITIILYTFPFLIGIISYVSKILLSRPIDALFQTRVSLFLDQLIKNTFLSSMMMGSMFFISLVANPIAWFDEDRYGDIAAGLIISIGAVTIIECFYYACVTYERKITEKKMGLFFRWVTSIVIFIVVLGAPNVVSAALWHAGHPQTALIFAGGALLLMVVVLTGLDHELPLIQKRRRRFVLKVAGSGDFSLLPYDACHTHTVLKDIQVFEPLDNFHQTPKTYYVCYPREQVVTKYIWDHRMNSNRPN